MKPLEMRVKTAKISHRFFEKSFTLDIVDSIFGNVEDILTFHRKLLNRLDDCMENWQSSQIFGDIFSNMVILCIFPF